MRPPIISLLSDFGSSDPYVAMMKATILEINPFVKIVDISHEMPKFNVRHAAFKLGLAAAYFAHDTIHVAVVDPGVGTERLPLAIKTRRYTFVGPDNGILSVAAEEDGVIRAHVITNERYFRKEKSVTFHGRDIFAPVAAYLSKGTPVGELGPRAWRYAKISLPKARRSHNHLLGEVIIVDTFGNLITNIRGAQANRLLKVGDIVNVEVSRHHFKVKFTSAYGRVGKGEGVALVGSSGFLELGKNQGSLAAALKGVQEADSVQISL